MRWSIRHAAHAACTFLEIAAIVAAVWWLGGRAHAFTGVPKGYDATGHLSKAQFLATNFPHVSWNYEWYSGQPTFAGSYPPGYHAILVVISRVAHVPLTTAMNAVSFGSVVLLLVGLHATIRAATGSRVSGLVAAGLLATAPTLWSQTVVLGLYPRFAALATLSPALACAVVHARRGTRLPALGACALLSLTLSIHPIVGALGIVLLVGCYLVQPGRPPLSGLAPAGAVSVAALGTAAYFYLPLALEKRSQSLFTDHERPLHWQMLLRPDAGSLDALTPSLLLLGCALAVVGAVLCKQPRVPHHDKVRLGPDVLILSDPSPGDALPPTASKRVARYLGWRRRLASAGYALRLSVFFAAIVPLFLGYGFIGQLSPRFPFYINGLQPADLLIYPAYLLSGVAGLVLGSGLRLLRHRITLAPRLPRAVNVAMVAITSAAGLALMGAAIAVPARTALRDIPDAAMVNDDDAQQARVSVFPTAADGQHDYRVAGAADPVTKWINETSDVAQTRGYDDHGALNLDWQVWLEHTMTDASQSAAEREFLFDWYAIKWIDTDSGTGQTAQYADTARYSLLSQQRIYGATVSSYRYLDAHPIASASDARSVLVIGDRQHYDLMLRALSYGDADSTTVVPVHGPTAVDDVSLDELRSFDDVLLYGATVQDAARDAAVLRQYVEGGGNLTVDDADNRPDIERLEKATGSPLPVAHERDVRVHGPSWAWTANSKDPLLSGVSLDGFGAASYAGSEEWSVSGVAGELRPWAHSILSTTGATVVATGQLGSGEVAWSGIGLPYHTAVFGSAAESRLLTNLLFVPHQASARTPLATARFVNSGRWRIDVGSSAHGVLLKEQDAKDWHATVDGRPARIFEAGPGMMWIPITPGAHVVDVRYSLSTIEKLGYGIAVVAWLVWLALLVSPALWRAAARRLDRLVSGSATAATLRPNYAQPVSSPADVVVTPEAESSRPR